MMRLLNTELRKILSYPTFLVFGILYGLLVLGIFCSIPAIKLPGPAMMFSLKSYYTFPDIWHTLTYLAGWFNLLLGVLVVILITNEFTFRMVRQNIIDGWTVNEFLLAKVLLLIFISLCSTAFVFILGLVYGLFASSSISLTLIFSESSFVLAYFVQSLAYLCFALFMGTLFKKAGMGIIFFLLYSKIIEPLMGWGLPDSISDYLPFHTISKLIGNPALKLVGINDGDSPLGIHFIFAVAYSCIFIFATYLLLTKRDN
jgi:ABC-2 type transport system permease protein